MSASPSSDDWRIWIDFEGDPRLAAEFEGVLKDRFAISRTGASIAVYGSSASEASQAQALIGAAVRAGEIDATIGSVQHWLAAEQCWDGSDPSWTQHWLYRRFEIDPRMSRRHIFPRLLHKLVWGIVALIAIAVVIAVLVWLQYVSHLNQP
jgi:hypothetical protein